MPLQCSPSTRGPGIRYLSFNQDYSCVSVATTDGIRIFNIDSQRVCYRNDLGAVSISEMLFCTSLVAYVGAGEQPALTPRKLTVMNTAANKSIQDLSFQSSVLAVRMNRERLVVILARKALVHSLQTLAHLRTLETPANTKGSCALTPCSEPCLLALPSSGSEGMLRVYDLMVDGGNVLCEIQAHKGPLACMAWNHDGTLLASASQQGTMIRVHKLPQASKSFTFRRGTTSAVVHSLAFTPAGVEPPLLCASSSHGTVHLFRLETPDRHPAMAVAQAAVGYLSAVIRVPFNDIVDPPRNIATIRLPAANIGSICAIHAEVEQPAAGVSMTAVAANHGHVLPDSVDCVVLLVASEEGIFYRYNIDELRNPAGPKCALVGEWTLLGSALAS